MSNRIGGSAIDSKRIPEEENSWQQENRIVKYLQQLNFKKKLFGVDEADVWKKIQELNHMYEESLKWERKRYDLLLKERTRIHEDDSE